MSVGYGDDFVLTLFTNDPALAEVADRAGVDRIGVDLERIGKDERQGHLPTWISDHREDDLPALATRLRQARLFARCNPVHAGSAEEIGRLLEMGVAVLMLPYFKSTREAETFVRLVDGRARVVLLVETRESAAVVPALCRIAGVDEIHIGLNDLRISLGWPSHFHVLASDYLARVCAPVLAAGLRLGVGGLGRAGDNDLPIPADLVAAQMPRLGASASLVSRAFFRPPGPTDLAGEVRALRASLARQASMPKAWLDEQQKALEVCLQRNFPTGKGLFLGG